MSPSRLAPLALAALLLLVVRPAGAHPFAVSSFEAKTSGRDIELDLRFDLTSVVDLITRARGGAKPAEAADVPRERRRVLGYLDERLRVSNAGQVCPREAEPRRFVLDAANGRVIVQTRYRCAAALDVLRMESTLFLDEGTPHQVVGTFRHLNALERYFFNGGERVATIPVNELRQMAVAAGGFRIVPPPSSRSRSKPAGSPANVPSPVDEARPRPVAAFTKFLEHRRWHVMSALVLVALTLSLMFGLRRIRSLTFTSS
jgi:hypothetical protein